MDIKEKISEVKNKAAKLAVKVAAMATLLTGSATASACANQGGNNDENKDKIENTEGAKTSVVFRNRHNDAGSISSESFLLENGDVLHQNNMSSDSQMFLQPGDTVTYNGNKIQAVRYKDGVGKNVNFGKIGKIGKGR